jgi:hypothetical protein
MKPFGHKKAKATQRFAVSFNRLPLPAVEYNSRYTTKNNNQQLVITVTANTEAEAIEAAWAQLTYQIKGGRKIGTNGSKSTFPRVGSPRIYSFDSIKKIGRF